MLLHHIGTLLLCDASGHLAVATAKPIIGQVPEKDIERTQCIGHANQKRVNTKNGRTDPLFNRQTLNQNQTIPRLLARS